MGHAHETYLLFRSLLPKGRITTRGVRAGFIAPVVNAVPFVLQVPNLSFRKEAAEQQVGLTSLTQQVGFVSESPLG